MASWIAKRQFYPEIMYILTISVSSADDASSGLHGSGFVGMESGFVGMESSQTAKSQPGPEIKVSVNVDTRADSKQDVLVSDETPKEISVDPTKFCNANIPDRKTFCQDFACNESNRTTPDKDRKPTGGKDAKKRPNDAGSKSSTGNELMVVFQDWNETTRNTWYFFNENGDSCHRNADFKDLPPPDRILSSVIYDPDHDLLFYLTPKPRTYFT